MIRETLSESLCVCTSSNVLARRSNLLCYTCHPRLDGSHNQSRKPLSAIPDHASEYSSVCSILWNILYHEREMYLIGYNADHNFLRDESLLLASLGLALLARHAMSYLQQPVPRRKFLQHHTKRTAKRAMSLSLPLCWSLLHVQSYSFLHVYHVNICKSASPINTDHV